MQRGVASILVFAMLAAAIVTAIPGAAQSSIRISAASTTGPAGCEILGQYVSVGGTAGFNTLVNPDVTTALRATGHVRLYEHANAIAAAIRDSPPSNPYAILNGIENASTVADQARPNSA